MLRQAILPIPDPSSLNHVVKYFQLHYYDVLTLSYAKAKEHLKELQVTDTHQVLLSFSMLCEDTLNKVQEYVQYFTKQVIPYANELNQKAQNGHNCEHCNGGCDMGHKSLLMQLYQGHQDLQRSVHELQMAALPLYSNLQYPEVYKSLRSDLHFLYSTIDDLIYLEESLLIPKLLESQKKINAHAI